MNLIKLAVAGILALFAAATADAQQFSNVPGRSVIGRLGIPGDTGPSAAIPFKSLAANLGLGASVVNFGAICSGLSIDADANATALATALATGKEVFIPWCAAGYHFGTHQITVNSGQSVIGENQVELKSTSTTSLFNVVGFNYPKINIGNLHIDMAGAGASSQAILLNNAAAVVYAVRISDVYFTNCVGAITDSTGAANSVVDLVMDRIRTAFTLGTQIKIGRSQGFIRFNQVQIDNTANTGAVTWDSINLGIVAGVEMNATDVTGPTTGTYQSGVYGIRITGTGGSAAVWMNRVNVDTTTGNGILISATNYVWLNHLDVNANLGNQVVLSTATKGEIVNSFFGGAIGRTNAAASAVGIDFASSSHIHVVNTATESNTGSGFHINNSTDNVFSNIRSQGNTIDGFVELGTSDRNLISGGIFDTNGTSDMVLIGANSRAIHYETSGAYVGSLTPWTVASGGTGRATLTIHAPLVGEGTAGINQVTAGTNGQLFLGSTGIDPLFATMSQDATITNAGVITVTKTNNVSFTAGATAAAGQLPGTATNDNASAGNVGEYAPSAGGGATAASSTVTITNASPGVISWTAHNQSIGSVINFTTTGGLPTGLTVGTNYYISSQGYAANSFSVSTTAANAIAGTSVNTSSAGSGTQTAVANGILASTTPINVGVLSLTAGDYDVWFNPVFNGATTTAVTNLQASISTTSATQNTAVGNFSTQAQNGVAIYNLISGSIGVNLPVGPVRISLASTTNVFGVAQSLFGTSTSNVSGIIRARRLR